ELWKSSRKFDGGGWSQPVKMPAHHKYTVGKIHVGMTLSDGTLLMPYSWDVILEEGKPVGFEGAMKLKSGVLRSRDGGTSWTPGGDMFVEVTKKASARGTGGVCEPAMVLLPSGEIFALVRTSDSWHYQSRSRDGGLTWDTPSPSPLAGHNSPSALWRLRDSGDVLVVWNNSPLNRWPLDVALSMDGCKTWSRPRTLANTPGFQSAYPTATQTADGVLIAIWFQILPDKARELRIARFNREWLLGASNDRGAKKD
ncbi:MAG: sialidase family protein, partial [Verrucomicrobiota bacterium]